MTHTNLFLRIRSWLVMLIATVMLQATAGIVYGDGHGNSRVPMPSTETAKGEKCVEPEDVMKRKHMEFILHQRDKTMHEGIRTKQYSLKNCVNCHADPQTQSVLGKDGFCESCHAYAAVSIDCFSCHTDSPEEQDAAVSGTVFGSIFDSNITK
ncbi:MAG: hypothetical protein OEY67_00465 [Gammaproteobacteria bacterium]|nr:hypothetical protein [Gammaproteobacteria bacterium]